MGEQKYELRSSQFNDPDQRYGQHTNGPANLFVREDDSCPWYFIEETKSKHKAKRMIEEIGLQAFLTRYCSKVMD